ncbi:MAG: hypothetical protein LUQ39_05035, partial [Methanomassiliicoccales archaeon]|nr:hypothetical protein [Methanomassiliicoccales archaeon]
FRKILPTGIKVIVQEFVAGPSSNMFSMATYVSRDGGIAPPCVWQKIRQSPVDYGVGTFVRIVDEPRIVEQGVRFLKGIGFTGIGEIEYKWDERANEFKLIELNARPWLQNSLSAYAGLDTSYLQYLDLTGSPSLEMRPCQKDIRWLDLLSDLSTFWTLRERGELSTLEWVRSCLGAEVHAYAALDDVRPMLSRYNYGLDLIKMLVFLLKGDA